MGGMNAAIEVGKHKLDVALVVMENVSEPNQARAITRLAKRLAELDCARVLIEGGSYQNVLIAALRAAELPVVIHQSAPGPQGTGHWSVGQDRPYRRAGTGTLRRTNSAAGTRAA